MNGMEHIHSAPFSGDAGGWIVTVVATILTLWTIALAIRFLVMPGETRSDHPKLLILKDDR